MIDTLSPPILLLGYSQGAFPMSEEDGSIHWYLPYVRAVFPIEGVHVSRSLARTLKKVKILSPQEPLQEGFCVTFDRDFTGVMRGCIRPSDNWINEHFVEVYTECHQLGWGHSCEVWFDGELVGGLYGIALGGVFCAESMFHRKTDCSKIALWAMVNKCRELGFEIFDAQLMNPHLERMGAVEMPQEEYMVKFSELIGKKTPWSIMLR